MTHPRMAQIEALWDKHVYFAEREEEEKKAYKVYCPECFRKIALYHLDFTAVVCRHCKQDIKKADLLPY
jgi:ribosomal protein L37AE/L43A